MRKNTLKNYATTDKLILKHIFLYKKEKKIKNCVMPFYKVIDIKKTRRLIDFVVYKNSDYIPIKIDTFTHRKDGFKKVSFRSKGFRIASERRKTLRLMIKWMIK